MSICYGDPVFDFDLNLLRPTPSTTVAPSSTDKQRKSILIVKKKIIGTDALIKKYFTKKELLDQTEKNLLSTKEECKQICIDYRKSVDSCSALGKDLQQLKDANKELESKYSHLESQYQAASSHANQLQSLVKEHETLIEALKIENKLGKNSDKDYKKMLQPLQKENSLLIKHICLARDIIFGKRKYRLRYKTILKKYDKYKSPDPMFEEDENNVDYVSDEIPLSPFSEEYDDGPEPAKDNKSQTVKHSNNADLSRITNNSIVESNDVASVDTGRGSSLASSVSDKSFHSPDYFISDSPLSDDQELNKTKTKLVDSSTSPISFSLAVNVSTSPIIFEHDLQKNYAMVDRALSPIVLIANVADDISNDNDDVSLRSERDDGQESCNNDNETIDCEKKQKEIECLELNNSENISKENSHDCEIEMILSTMKLHNTLITPIPSTPAKSSSGCTPNKQNQPVAVVCSEAALAREENKKLQESVAELAKELANIKSMLSSKSSINEGQTTSLIQSTSKHLPSHEINTTFCAVEKTSSNFRRKSLDVNMDFVISENLQAIPEVEENFQDTSELQSGDKPANMNESHEVVDNVSEITELVPEIPARIFCTDDQRPTRDDKHKGLLLRRNKLTKLEKLKRKCLPKYKIRKEQKAFKKQRVKPTLIPIYKKKTVTKADTSATLNDKNVYDKAVKVMSELKRTKPVCPDSEIVEPIERNLEENPLITIDTELSNGNKQKISGYCDLSTTVMEYQSSEPIDIPIASPKSHISDVNQNEVENVNEEHVVVNKVFSKSPEGNKSLKRGPENISPEIPCKRTLHSSILDMIKGNNLKIILQRCETSTILKDKSAPENVADTLKNIPLTLKGKTSPSKVNNAPNILSVDIKPTTPKPLEQIETQNNNSNRRKSVKDMSLQQVSPKAIENKDTHATQGLPSNRRKSVRSLFSPEAISIVPDYQESHEKPDLIRIKDIFASEVIPQEPERQEKNRDEKLVSRRKSVKDMSSLETNSGALGRRKSKEDEGVQGLVTNRRKSVKDISSPEVSPRALKSQKNNVDEGIQDFTRNRRKSIKDNMCSLDASPKASETEKINSIQDLPNRRRKSIKDMSSLEASPKVTESQKINSIQDLPSSRRKSIKDMFSPEASPKASESQSRNSTHGIQELLNKRRKSLKDISSPEVSTDTSENQKINNIQAIQGLPSSRRISARDVSFPPVSPRALEGQENNKNQGLKDITSNRRKSVKSICSPEINSAEPQNQAQLDNQNLTSDRKKDVKDSGCSSNLIAPDQSVTNKRRKIDTCSSKVSSVGPEHSNVTESQSAMYHAKESVLCRMIEQYGVKSVKFGVKKIPDSIINTTAKKIEAGIIRIIEVPGNETKDAMNRFVIDIQSWEINHFVKGLIQYLRDPVRKIELFSKVVVPSAPALTKSEQILLYVILELKKCWVSVDIVDKILCYLEYTLFSLNRTPQFEVIESMSHFYAVVCRYFKMKTRLRLFVLDAMYCIQFKAIPLIRQCIEVWMHILPLAHMTSAQTPLVTCLVYLLHFYKCEDKLNRVQEIRNILSRKYFYKITEWNESRILELCKNSITSLKDIPSETKMLRLALIILAKRQGPRWCHNNIVKNVLQPIIEKQNNPDHIKAFCVSMFGPLLKPYPADMKVHCEIVMNQLFTMLQDDRKFFLLFIY
ncbi:hypothetical protein O3G_MSEX011316 [Manduca sexta]|uniref:Uncharacterized protein n=1 Tax=Manduca sexta TaxID=7130 RepID=A0A921ZL39_MANSE|nr:hypothetical protein O3G_MSEX011316 [Manduca sexta]